MASRASRLLGWSSTRRTLTFWPCSMPPSSSSGGPPQAGPGGVLEDLRRLPAVLGAEDDHLPALQDAGQGEDVAHVVVDDQDLLAGERGVALEGRSGLQAGRVGQAGADPVEEQGRLGD